MVPPGGAPSQPSPGGGSHVDWKRLDKARREVGPVHLDLIEHYASGKVSRRNFIRRGTIIGLSMPVIGAVIAACGGDDDGDSGSSTTAGGGGATSTTAGGASTSAAPGTTGAGQAGGTIRVAYQAPAGPLDPIQMQDLGTYGLIAQSFEFLIDARRGRRAGARPRRVVGAQRGRHGLDLQAARGRQVAGRHGLHVGRRGGDDGPPRRRRERRPAGRHRRGRRRHHRSEQSRCSSSRRPNGNFPYLVSVFNAQTPITPVSYETGTTLDQVKNGTGPWKLVHVRRRDRGDVRAQPGLVGRADAARRPGDHVLRRGRHDGHGHPGRGGRRASCSSRCSAATRCSTTRTSTCSRSRRRPTGRSGWAPRPASSSRRRRARRWRTRSTASR